MKSLTKIIVLLALAALALPLSGQMRSYESVPGDPLGTRIYTLDNGLKVYMNVNHEVPRVQTYIAVRVGAKNDPSETTGLAHYFEHLMFKGTERFGTQDYAAEKVLLDRIEAEFEVYRTLTDASERTAAYRIIDSLSYEASKYAIPNEYDKLMAAIGSQGTNAFTSNDITAYIEDIPSNQVENWARIQADRFENAVIRGFHTELETVYEEKNMSLTQDRRKVSEWVSRLLFPGHPYGRESVLGSQEHLKNPSITTIKNFYNTWYVPNNMAICLSGDLDPDKTMDIIERYFGALKPNYDLPAMDIKAEEPITSPIVKEIYGPEAPSITIAWRADNAHSPNAETLDLLGSILSNGKAGLLDVNLNQQLKVLGAGGYGYAMPERGMFQVQGRPKEGQSLDEVRELLMEQIAKLKAGEFSEDLIIATVNNYKAEWMDQIDTNNGRAMSYLYSVMDGTPWERTVNSIARKEQITKQELVDYANSILGDDNYVVIYKLQGPDPNVIQIDKPHITPILTNRDARSDFLAEMQQEAARVAPIEPVFVDFKEDLGFVTVKSGIPVIYKKNETNDLFELRYIFETGLNNDPALSLAFTYHWYLGTDTMTPEQLQYELYKLACSYGISPGYERTTITISGLSENMDKAVELVESKLYGAKGDEQTLASVKADLLKSYANAKLNQNSNFSMLRTYSIYGPKSPVTNRLPEDRFASITSDELLSKIRSFINQEHRITYYGPMGEQELVSHINLHHNVPATLTAVPKLVTFPRMLSTENRVFIAEYDADNINMSQTTNYNTPYDPSKEAIVELYNSYFGGGMNAIVFQELREARGLAYTAQAWLGNPSKKENPYIYTTYIATQHDKMTDALEAFDNLIEEMPVSENAFNIARESVISDIRSNRIIKSEVITKYLEAQDLGIDYDRRRNIYEGVQRMKLDDIVNFQKEWVKGRNYNFVILGRPALLDMDKLGSLGTITHLTQEDIFGY